MNIGHKKRAIAMYIMLGFIMLFFTALIVSEIVYMTFVISEGNTDANIFVQLIFSMTAYILRMALYMDVCLICVFAIIFTNKVKLLSLVTLLISSFLFCLSLIMLFGGLGSSMLIVLILLFSGTIPLLALSIVDFILLKPFRKE